jgi:signal transduction histidine kinase/ActR/RegA family two-component response regulator/HAMP domain-containing protein
LDVSAALRDRFRRCCGACRAIYGSLKRFASRHVRLFGTRSISSQLFTLIGLSAVSLAMLSVFAALSLKQELLDATIRETTDIAEVARSTAQTFYDKAARGELDEATAQAAAKMVIRNMRYGNDEYFFVYDDTGKELVHGTMPEREGRNYLHATDAYGYSYIPDMLALARSGGGRGGHVFYWFPKPGVPAPLLKVSSAIRFAPWGWMISTGAYLEDINAQFWASLRNFALIGCFSVVLVSIITFLISQSIANPIRALASVTARIGRGQLDIDVPATERSDEIGVLAGTIRVLRDEAKVAESLRSEQERLNRALRTVGAGNAVLFDVHEENDLVARMCEAIVEAGGYRMAWIGMAEHDEARTVRAVATAGHDDGYLSSAGITWGDADYCGPAGLAIRNGAPQVNDDTTSEITMAPWRTSALERNLRSSIALPMKGPSGVMGCVTIYASETRAFSATEIVSLLVDLANNLARGIFAARERRRREEMERQLNQAQKMEGLGQLAGSIAHDFNNLLGAILGLAGFILEDTSEDHSTRHHATRIISAGQRGKTLVRQILSFARRDNLRREFFSMTEMVEETRGLLSATIPATTELSLVVNAADACWVTGDHDQLQQGLINLCINAHDALEGRPGRVTIALGPTEIDNESFARMTQGASDEIMADRIWTDAFGNVHATVGSLDPRRRHVSLTVTDTGCGIPIEVAENIFTPFFTTKHKSYGTGLGLSTVHSAVLAHGGGLTLSSKLGGGSTFEVALPLGEETDSRAPAPPPVVDRAPVKAEGRLLLVDDDPDFGDMLMIALERRGFEISPCIDPREALEAMQQHPESWDAVIADQVMPHMTGIDLIAELHKESPGLPCILCTAFAGDQLDAERLKEAGVHALMHKPVDIDELTEHLMRAITERRH